MRKIQLNNGATIELPEDWSEVPAEHRELIWAMFYGYLQGRSSLFQWQLTTLMTLTDYSPSRRLRRALEGKSKAPVEEIQFNLIKLSESLIWPFSSFDDARARRVRNQMLSAPFDCTLRFDRRQPALDTNLTAGVYRDIVELLGLISDLEASASEAEPTESESEDSTKTIVWAQRKLAETIGAETGEGASASVRLFAFTLWTTGIVEFFQQHPTYGVLYRTASNTATISQTQPTNELSSPKSRLLSGIRETMLELEQRGYQDVEQMPIEKFMDAQVKMLQDDVRRAVADGVKKTDICARTGLTAEELEQLV